MKRREFLYLGGSLTAAAVFGHRTLGPARELWGRPANQEAEPLTPEIYRQRIDRARDLMADFGLDALFCEPATNFEYLAGARFGRSERLIALVVPTEAEPFVVAPSFELERVERAIKPVAEIRGWEEHESPYRVIAATLASTQPGRIGVEPSTRFGVAKQLEAALTRWKIADADPLFTQLRIIKSDVELALIRRAITITEASIAATFADLEPGLSDREVAGHLSELMRDRGARGGGLVQFGPTSAIPHGGTENRRLTPGTPVLIDAGCRVNGYTSDITRMHVFGAEPSAKFREIFNVVLAAQTSAYQAGKAGIECQQLDRTARRVISEAGYGEFFTHRLGHGMGMDGHEPPYLVEGNARKLEPGMVFTIEPGIYLPGEWGVRIEDDFVVREDRLEPLSSRVAPL